MKIICLVKFVPTKNGVTGKAHLSLDPEAGKALAAALDAKKRDSAIQVGVVCMGPRQVAEPMQDFVRLGADWATLLSDKAFAGSDSYATAKVLGEYLKTKEFDYIFTGTHTTDGATGNIGPQVAAIIEGPQLSEITELQEITEKSVICQAPVADEIVTARLLAPAVLSFSDDLPLRPGFVRLQDSDKDVNGQFELITNEQLGLDIEHIGLKGSPTVVRKNKILKIDKERQQELVHGDESGVERVYQFLKEKGLV